MLVDDEEFPISPEKERRYLFCPHCHESYGYVEGAEGVRIKEWLPLKGGRRIRCMFCNRTFQFPYDDYAYVGP